MDPAVPTKKLIAIDRDPEALEHMRAKVTGTLETGTVTMLAADFTDVEVPGDVVYFEFCLHEMDDPEMALAHGKKLAPDIVVFEHSVGSEWVFYADEEEKVRKSAEALSWFQPRRRARFDCERRFRNYPELLAKVSSQGELAVQRVQRFLGATNIIIPMSYEAALL